MKRDKKRDSELTEVISQLKFSKDPLKVSLHRNLDSQENKVAVETFQSIMAYMGDYPTKASPTYLVQSIISVGIPKEIMRDEIFAQILKQIVNNKSQKK